MRNFYTPSQVARLLGVKPSTVYAWISRNEIHSTKVGYSRFISNFNIENFQASRGRTNYKHHKH